jgi:hypothetical protein
MNIEYSTHRSARLIVVQIHLLAQRPPSLACIHKLPRKLEPESNVVRTSTPLPVTHAHHLRQIGRLRRPCLMTVVTRTRLYRSFAASARYRMRHRCTSDGIDERRFSAACKPKCKRRRNYYYFILICEKIIWFPSEDKRFY